MFMMAVGKLGVIVKRPNIKMVRKPSKLQLCLLLLMMCGDVKQNPGPGPARNTRQTILSQSTQGDLTMEPCLADILREIRYSRTELMVEMDSETLNAKYENIGRKTNC